MDAGSAPKVRPKVLIVDDQPQMRLLVRTALEKLPVDILEAGDGKQAMGLIETQQPDLLLSDYEMPNCDGLTLCHQLHRRTDLKPIKTVLITGALMPANLLEAVNHKMVDAALAKPVDVKELQQLVKQLLALE
jgi:sigma-B regulation protein RsbU (phosphoserine phosphatase)